MDSVLAIKPPKRIMGIVKSGATAVAEVMSLAHEEIVRPMPIEFCATRIMIRYTCKKFM